MGDQFAYGLAGLGGWMKFSIIGLLLSSIFGASICWKSQAGIFLTSGRLFIIEAAAISLDHFFSSIIICIQTAALKFPWSQ